MPLTQDEKADISRMLDRMEKAANSWRFWRWGVIVYGLIHLSIVVACFFLAHDIHEAILSLPCDAATCRTWMPAVSGLIVNNCMAYVFGMVFGCIGAMSLVFAIGQSNKVKQDMLLIKLARSCLDGRGPQEASEVTNATDTK